MAESNLAGQRPLPSKSEATEVRRLIETVAHGYILSTLARCPLSDKLARAIDLHGKMPEARTARTGERESARDGSALTFRSQRYSPCAICGDRWHPNIIDLGRPGKQARSSHNVAMSEINDRSIRQSPGPTSQ